MSAERRTEQRFNLDDYITVQERINRFWAEHPDGAILTILMSDPTDFTTCRYRADVYKQRDRERPDATGWAFEIAGQGMANRTSHEENCETSAIGRALANLGMATSHKDRPSREEMSKALSPVAEVRPLRAPPRNAPAPPPPAPAGDASDKQRGMLWGIFKDKLGQDRANEALHAVVLGRFGYESTTHLSKREASDLIEQFKDMPERDLEETVAVFLFDQAHDNGQTTLPMDEPAEEEAGLIHFRERCEAAESLREVTPLVEEAGVDGRKWAELVATRRTVQGVNALVGMAPQIVQHDPHFQRAKGTRLGELKERANRYRD